MYAVSSARALGMPSKNGPLVLAPPQRWLGSVPKLVAAVS